MQRIIISSGLLLAFASNAYSADLAGSTPQATFNAMKAAASKQDWAGTVSCMTPESQDQMIGGMAMMVEFMSSLGGADKFKGAKDILNKHGVKFEMPKGKAANQDPTAAMKKATAGVKDKSACLGELMTWFDKNGDKKQPNFNPEDFSKATLTDVKINGDKATGKITGKKDGKDKVEDESFRKINGKWYVEETEKKKGK